MYKKTLVTGLALATLALNAAASQSLIETYELAVANDPSLAVARLNAESAQLDARSGFAAVLPSVNASVSYGVGSKSKTNDKGKAQETLALNFDAQSLSETIRVNQNIFVLAAFTAYDALNANASRIEMEALQAEQNLMVSIAEQYIGILKAKDALDVLNAQLEAVSRQYQQTEQRYEVGLVTKTDVLDAAATLDQTRVSLIRAESAYDIALQGLYSSTGSIPESIKSLSEDLPVRSPSEQGQQKWVDYAVSKHPDILIAEKGLEVGELTLKARRQERLPSVVGSFSVTHSDVFGSKQTVINPSNGNVITDDALNNDFEKNWSASVGLTVSMDLYSGGSKTVNIAKAAISNNITEQNIELLKRGKAVEVANLYRTVRADAQNVKARQQALASSESALQATQVGYEVGTRNIVEVLNSQLNKFSAQNNLNNARYDYILNLLRLKQAAGQLSIDDLESIEQYLVD
ncbi:MAG: TolC family outer membrane protein [Reinekea sp.]|jgi:outer membrane protein